MVNVKLTKWSKHSQVILVIPFILSTGHTVHTLVPRVTVLVPAMPGHTVHTLDPRVTVQVPVGESLLSILQQSLFRSLSVQVILFSLCILLESLLWYLAKHTVIQNIQASKTQVSTITVCSSTPPGHSAAVLLSQFPSHSSVTAVTAIRSWSSGHRPMVTPNTLTFTLTCPHIHSLNQSWSCGHRLKVILTTLNHTLSHNLHTPISISSSHSISNKMRNKLIKQTNGNGKSTLAISHWNLGSKLWKNKRNQIQALVEQTNPDILFISEANLDDQTPTHESMIAGYTLSHFQKL